MPLVIDIETVGREPEALPPRALSVLFSRVNAPDLPAEELARRQEELVQRFALDPVTGRVVCIGLLDVDSGATETFCGRDETRLLELFWDKLGSLRPELFVTFNGKSFDFPYLNIRSALLEVPPSVPLPIKPFSVTPHFDVREVLASGERGRSGSLDFFAAIFGLPSPKAKLDGARVGEAFLEGRFEEIQEYCLADCRATAGLYRRLKPYYFW